MNDDILNKVNRSDGTTVPEGYFDEFAARMKASLPHTAFEDAEPKVLPRSIWQRLRPYVGLAAMFAGIWCMMQMFNLISPADGHYSPDNNAILAEAISNESFMDEYYYHAIDNDYEFYDQLYSDGFIPTSVSSTSHEHNAISI